jgi:nucleoside-diphosphate-sugar epimerase
MAMALVTGGAGFIGSHIVRRLLELGHSVRVLDNLSTGREGNLKGLKEKVEITNGDIRDLDTVKAAVQGMDYVFHQAAMASVPRSLKNPRETMEVNVRGTLNILLCSRDSGIKRLVFASSSSVYGDSETLPKREDMPANPISPYALSKLECEEWCRLFGRLYGLETVILRYFNIFGPNQSPDSEYAAVIPKFIKAFLDSKPPVIFGDGTQTRDFTFVSDVVEANMLAMNGRAGTYNIGSGKRITLNDVVKMLCKITKKEMKTTYSSIRAGDVKHSLADISLAGEGLGYRPKHTLEQGLGETIEWFRRE